MSGSDWQQILRSIQKDERLMQMMPQVLPSPDMMGPPSPVPAPATGITSSPAAPPAGATPPPARAPGGQ